MRGREPRNAVEDLAHRGRNPERFTCELARADAPGIGAYGLVLTDVDLLTIILKFASALGIDRMMAARVWHVSMVWSVATKAVLASLSQDHTMWSRACRRDRLNKPPHRTFLVNQL